MADKSEGEIPNTHSNSQQTDSDSDDQEIDYSIKPEFYDPNLDEEDEKWVRRKRNGRESDAVLSCPACFTTLCLESQRHETLLTQYRAIFVVNCRIEHRESRGCDEVTQLGKRGRAIDQGESLKPVLCSVCGTEVGVFDEDEVYHFFNVLPSE